ARAVGVFPDAEPSSRVRHPGRAGSAAAADLSATSSRSALLVSTTATTCLQVRGTGHEHVATVICAVPGFICTTQRYSALPDPRTLAVKASESALHRSSETIPSRKYARPRS